MMDRFSRDDENSWGKEYSDDEEWKKAHNEWLNASSSTPAPRLPDDVWDEARWETFFQTIDRDGRRVIAYYEKFWNHPDPDLMVEEAMAMHVVREGFREMFPDDYKRVYFEEYLVAESKSLNIRPSGFQSFLDAKEHSIQGEAAFVMTREFHRELSRRRKILSLEPPQTKLMESMVANTAQAYGKVVGGHVMGYHRYTMGGNLASCKRALASMNRVADALIHFKLLGWPAKDDLYLDEILLESRSAIAMRVSDLRDRFLKENPIS
jgi:hypothetical protein